MPESQVTILIVLAVLNCPVYWLAWRVIFGSWDAFWEAVRYAFQPDLISLFTGQWGEDWYNEMKLGLFFAICVGMVAGQYYLITVVFGDGGTAAAAAAATGSG
ncbi:MAG: hypothetical protein D8M59_10545 [Planctomycetes bacterium]|nr:hypothetical protein [Planctomycetota bacterium]NOG55282.1 hypothetical protein [Planctomycetota bacterium]